MSPSFRLPVAAAVLYVVWVVLTWWFEGRLGTFVRPDAVADRIAYALVVNLLVGIVITLAVLRWGAGNANVVAAAGFGSGKPSLVWAAVAVLVGFGGYAILGAPSLDPVVLINAYAQVFVVTAAEILVCWALPAAAFAAFSPNVGLGPRIALLVLSAVLFGVYHFAHSAPFDTLGMVLFLTGVGLVTGAFFALSADAYATMLFHNFMGMLGVTQALATAGTLDSLSTPQVPLVATAGITVAAVLAMDHLVLRRSL